MRYDEREILCVDMDAFFVSVEQASDPSLKGRPIAVVGSGKRSVVVTSSYEARAKGVKTGMSRKDAQKVCPEIILIPGRMRKYAAVSAGIAKFLQSVSPESAMFSIDEAFLDITGTGFSSDNAAYMIKSRIKQNFGITCTVGAGPNKLIAKMATHVNKPDGYYRVSGKDALAFMDSFRLSDIWGIGRSSVRKFTSMGIFRASDMRLFGERRLEEMMGLPGRNIYRLVSGESECSIPKDREEMKSFSHSMTFPKDISSRSEACAYLLQLSEMVSSRARKNSYYGRAVTLTVRRPDMSTLNFSHTLSFKTSATHHIYDCAVKLYDGNGVVKEPVRLLGVSLSGLGHRGIASSSVEDMITEGAVKNRLYRAIDAVNMKFGERTIGYASVMKCERKKGSG